MRIAVLLLLPVTLLTGCLSIQRRSDFLAKVEGLQGRPLSEFKQEGFRLEQSESTVLGCKILTFSKNRVHRYRYTTAHYSTPTNVVIGQNGLTAPSGSGLQPGMSIGSGGSNTESHLVVGSSTASKRLFCKIVLMVDKDDRILSVRYDGNDCW